jgi:hypothetical protein
MSYLKSNYLSLAYYSGCILAELYTGYAILPGEDESDQLACIIELLGMPPKQVLGKYLFIFET